LFCVLAPTGPPLNFTEDKGKSHNSIQVAWEMPVTSKIHGDLLRYLVHARPISPLSTAQESYQPVHPSVNNMILEHLKPNTKYNVTVAAINQYGVGAKTAFITRKSIHFLR